MRYIEFCLIKEVFKTILSLTQTKPLLPKEKLYTTYLVKNPFFTYLT